MEQEKQALFEQAFLEVTELTIKYDEIERDKNGKLRPVKGWHISTSHSEDFLVIVIDRDDVGTDIEDIRHTKKMTPRVLRRILAPNEKAVNGNYLNNFVIKEAFSKLTGEGLSVGFSRYDANELIKKYRATDYSTDEYVWWILQGSNL